MIDVSHLFVIYNEARANWRNSGRAHGPLATKLRWRMARAHLDELREIENQRRRDTNDLSRRSWAAVGMAGTFIELELLPPVDYANPGQVLGLPIVCDDTVTSPTVEEYGDEPLLIDPSLLVTGTSGVTFTTPMSTEPEPCKVCAALVRPVDMNRHRAHCDRVEALLPVIACGHEADIELPEGYEARPCHAKRGHPDGQHIHDVRQVGYFIAGGRVPGGAGFMERWRC